MIVKVRVSIGKEKQKIIEEDDRLLVDLKSQARDSKANLELVRLLKKYFNSRSGEVRGKDKIENIKIIKGLRSRDKVVRINEI
jgi:uncharacterized protein YggU (UPF0235/DUF167 family)|tara:strand:- start:218 stop:466 length:249 start_codon:yes stop_codon:yes gene_type:complete